MRAFNGPSSVYTEIIKNNQMIVIYPKNISRITLKHAYKRLLYHIKQNFIHMNFEFVVFLCS